MGIVLHDPRFADPFLDKLRLALPDLGPAPARLAVAFSGGADSTVLLAALCRLGLKARLRALHIDHGQNADSRAWAEHCRKVARALDVDFRAARVHVDESLGLGFEGAAREARYSALCELLAPGEILLTAHHADDQLETVLLRLMRGAGVRGLSAIAELRATADVRIARPLLGFSRAEIRAQARLWDLEWLEDPSNDDLRHDRNFLRAEILPKLTRRWPAAGRSAVRLARHMREADRLLTELAVLDLGEGADPGRLDRARLRELGADRQRNALRFAIRERGLPVPSTAQLEELRTSLSVTRPDAQTTVTWPGAEARVYRDQLYLIEPLARETTDPAEARLAPGAPWIGAEGRLCLEPADDPALPEDWVRAGIEIRFRRGGERFKPLNRTHSLPLKQLFQEAGIVPWMRGRIPLLYRQDRLVAVADLWVTDAARAEATGGRHWRVSWTDHPPIR